MAPPVLKGMVASADDEAVRLLVWPRQIVAGVLATTGVLGVVFTVTLTGALLVHPFSVAWKVYVPLAAKVAFAVLGSSNVLVNPFGPLQRKLVPMSVVPWRAMGCPVQAKLADALAVGSGRWSTVVVAVAVPPQLSVITQVHVPGMFADTVVLVGVPTGLLFGSVHA
jgi:hypothetical protein